MEISCAVLLLLFLSSANILCPKILLRDILFPRSLAYTVQGFDIIYPEVGFLDIKYLQKIEIVIRERHKISPFVKQEHQMLPGIVMARRNPLLKAFIQMQI
jgi:hypothetical protein